MNKKLLKKGKAMYAYDILELAKEITAAENKEQGRL